MPLLPFVQDQILAVDRAPATESPDPRGCLDVVRVAPSGPAASIGIRPGDVVVRIDGKPAASGGHDLSLRPYQTERTWVFQREDEREAVHVRTTGAPLGVMALPTPQGVAERTRRGEVDFAALRTLWERGHFALLAELLEPLFVLRTGLGGVVARMVGSDTFANTPAQVLWGAALYELGRREKGHDLIEAYLKDAAASFTAEYRGIAELYLGMHCHHAAKDRSRALAFFESAWSHLQHERVATTMAEHGGRYPEPSHRWIDRPFPVPYQLPRAVGRGAVSLAATLEALQPEQLFLVCALDEFRGNGPYDVFMRRWTNWRRAMPSRLGGLHVITRTAERRADRPWWFAGEDAARRLALPFDVLLESGQVASRLAMTTSPYLMCLDHRGAVLAEHSMDEVILWQALAAVAEP